MRRVAAHGDSLEHVGLEQDSLEQDRLEQDRLEQDGLEQDALEHAEVNVWINATKRAGRWDRSWLSG